MDDTGVYRCAAQTDKNYTGHGCFFAKGQKHRRNAKSNYRLTKTNHIFVVQFICNKSAYSSSNCYSRIKEGCKSGGSFLRNKALLRQPLDFRIDTCFICGNGDLKFARAGQITDEQTARAFLEENQVRFSLAFGPILLENGELITNYYYPIGEVARAFSRAALCQQGPLHYVLVTANYGGADIVRFAQTLQAKGILTAYTLDGGQTATIVTGDQLINRVDYGGQREISDIIYFATAIPNGG